MSNNTVSHDAKALGIVLKVACVLPFVTGVVDVLGGTRILAVAGVSMPPEMASDPILNNQIGFWGAIWFGFGLALWWASNDVVPRAALLRILFATLLLSGLGRALSVTLHGWAGAPLAVAMVVELAGSIGLIAWLGAVTRSDGHPSAVQSAV